MAFLKRDTEEKLQNIIDSLNAYEKDMLYRMLWLEYVKSDIKAYADENDVEVKEGDVDVAADRYVFYGQYDCNISYWDNIENLISDLQ